jgi:hypothetical protein
MTTGITSKKHIDDIILIFLKKKTACIIYLLFIYKLVDVSCLKMHARLALH